MKEILKFLRQLNNYSHDQVAALIGVSRQSYSKYEKGTVLPSEQTVTKLAEIYKVAPSYFYEGKRPSSPEQLIVTTGPGAVNNNRDLYSINENKNSLRVAEPENLTLSSTEKSWDVYYDGNTLRLADNTEAHFSKGQRFKLVERKAEEDKRREALETINSILQEIPPYEEEFDDDPFYKKAIQRRIEEKYGFIN